MVSYRESSSIFWRLALRLGAAVYLVSPAAWAGKLDSPNPLNPGPAPEHEAVPTVKVTPLEDSRAVLHNPDMGWVFYEFGKQRSSGYTYPDVDYVAIATHWCNIERSQGSYDFSALDSLYDYWAAKGKKVMLRLMVEDVGTRAPGYVLKQLGPAEVQSRSMVGDSQHKYMEIDCRSPFYQARLAAFLSALASHYAPAGPRPIVTADLRGFGLWGEWHSGFVFPGMPTPGTQAPAHLNLTQRTRALRQIIDIWSSSMTNITLLLSYSHDPDSPSAYWNEPSHCRNYLSYSAFDYATRKANISWRRDGCFGAIQHNERTFNNYLFRLGKAPLFSEFANAYQSNRADQAVDDALSLHPNYICVYGYSGHSFYDNNRDVFERGLRTMGYRFVPVMVSYPQKVSSNCLLTFDSTWVNRAVGRSVVDYILAVKLKDAGGSAVFTADTGSLGCSRWIKGEQLLVTKSVKLGGLSAGDYRLCIGVVDPRTGKAIGLPLKAREADGFCYIGSLRLE